MIKIFLALMIFIFSSIASYAQVDMFNGSLAEAIEKAKSENKLVMVIASATWCSPCKKLINEVFKTKEAGDYVNSRLVVVKYYLDKEDPDHILTKYRVAAYPTCIIIDHNGNEVNRKLGGASSARQFISNMKETLNPDNMYPAYEKRLSEDSSTAMVYVSYLINDCLLGARASDIIVEKLSESIDKNFLTTEALKTYMKLFTTTDSKVLDVFLRRGDEISEIVGAKVYSEYMAKVGRQLSDVNIMGRKKDFNKAATYLEFINKHTPLSSDYTEHFRINLNIYKNADFDKIEKATKKTFKRSDDISRRSLVQAYLKYVGKEYVSNNTNKVISVIESAKKHEKSTEVLGRYNKQIEKLNNVN